jgi:SAM-dependent methyltransferase
MNDKQLERKRYDDRVANARKSLQSKSGTHVGASSVPVVLRAPYTYYEAMLMEVLGPDSVVLEIGSGTGEFTESLLRTSAKVIASDISQQSLELLSNRYSGNKNLSTVTCDMENLPFSDGMFDAVVSAGSLSYGDNQLVMRHIHRLLKKSGYFICVDSLNHNPVYRVNRYIHFLQGDRSYSTLQRMPTVELIRKYQIVLGGISRVRYFGGLSWLIMVLAKLGFESFWADVSDKIDRFCQVRRSAFKFVLMARKDL